MKYIVKIKVGDCEANFGYEDAMNAARFMQEAIETKTEEPDSVEITMEAREEQSDK